MQVQVIIYLDDNPIVVIGDTRIELVMVGQEVASPEAHVVAFLREAKILSRTPPKRVSIELYLNGAVITLDDSRIELAIAAKVVTHDDIVRSLVAFFEAAGILTDTETTTRFIKYLESRFSPPSTGSTLSE